MSIHVGRSFTGHPLEDQCPCPQEPCGLVNQDQANIECEHHQVWGAKTIRQAHAASVCPARPEDIEVISLGEDGDYWLVTGTTDAHSADVAVREHSRGESGEELEDDLGFEYRRDLVWRHGGRKPSRVDDDELLNLKKYFERYAREAKSMFPFAGFLVTL